MRSWFHLCIQKNCNKTVIPSLSPFLLPSSPFTEHYSHLPSPPPPPFMYSFFSPYTSHQAGAVGGAGHLVNFKGTDTIASLIMAR